MKNLHSYFCNETRASVPAPSAPIGTDGSLEIRARTVGHRRILDCRAIYTDLIALHRFSDSSYPRIGASDTVGRGARRRPNPSSGVPLPPPRRSVTFPGGLRLGLQASPDAAVPRPPA